MSGWLLKDVMAIVVSTAALTLAVINFVRTSRISDRQFALTFTQDVNKWAGEVMQLFKDIHLIIAEDLTREQLRFKITEICHKLSVTWDQGRFLFPNIEVRHNQSEKETAYRGVRHPVIEVVADFHDQLTISLKQVDEMIDDDDRLVDEVYVRIRRMFVSEVQSAIGTRRRFKLAQIDRHSA